MIVPTALNGRLDEQLLGTLPGCDGDGTPHRAELRAVSSYYRLRAAMTGAGLGDLTPSDGWSCYRTRADQLRMRQLGLTTVPVGKSIHGEALAVDYANLGSFGSKRHGWMVANAPRYGWYQPSWATASGSLPEPWHWEYAYWLDEYATGPDPTPSEDDEMNDQQSQQLAELHRAMGAGGALALPEAESALARLKRIEGSTNGLPDVLARIDANTAGVPDVLAEHAGAIAAVGRAVDELSRVVYIGSDGTPWQLTVYQRLVRVEGALGTTPKGA